MATVEQMEKKRSRQIVEILTAVYALVTIVNELRTEVAELKTRTSRTDEILAAIRSTALDIGQQTRQASIAIGSMADEMVNLKTEIAELQSAIAQPPAATRRTKK
jgi:chromosome segregation ATPase